MTKISTLTLEQIEDLHRLYHNQWWSRDRTFEETQAIVRHSNLVVGFTDNKSHLIAFARVLSDFTIKALIFDLIVDKPHRHKGLGKALLQTIYLDPSQTLPGTPFRTLLPPRNGPLLRITGIQRAQSRTKFDEKGTQIDEDTGLL